MIPSTINNCPPIYRLWPLFLEVLPRLRKKLVKPERTIE